MRGSGISRSLPLFRPMQNGMSESRNSRCSAPWTKSIDGKMELACAAGCALMGIADDEESGDIQKWASRPEKWSQDNRIACGQNRTRKVWPSRVTQVKG